MATPSTFAPYPVTLKKSAQSYVPKEIWSANQKHQLYAITTEKEDKIFVSDGPKATGQICTHVLVTDIENYQKD
ncbi:MAG: hypothetical protein HDQ88_07795 [Clostridia bacterium]|nr:hypothetical protein [Clostridia bacterium]